MCFQVTKVVSFFPTGRFLLRNLAFDVRTSDRCPAPRRAAGLAPKPLAHVEGTSTFPSVNIWRLGSL